MPKKPKSLPPFMQAIMKDKNMKPADKAKKDKPKGKAKKKGY